MVESTKFLSYGSGDVANIVTRPDGTKEYHVNDNLGSVRLVVSDAGNVISQKDYAPYGDELWQGGIGYERRSWIGKEEDRESDLGDFGVRKYDSELGRFLSCDALWENREGGRHINMANLIPFFLMTQRVTQQIIHHSGKK